MLTKSAISLVASLALLVWGSASPDAGGSIITVESSEFSLGYGFIRTGSGVGTWSTTETGAANTSTTQGDFTFAPAVTGTLYSNAGSVFPLRVFDPGTTTSGVGRSDTFSLSVAASYVGSLPPQATSPAIKLNITQVRIRGLTQVSFSGTDLAWAETTVGNTQTSPAVILQVTSTFTNPSFYTILSWNPTDVFVSGVAGTRTFGLLSSNLRAVDAFEIFGTVQLQYTVVPEPSTFIFVVNAIGLLSIRIRQRTQQSGSYL